MTNLDSPSCSALITKKPGARTNVGVKSSPTPLTIIGCWVGSGVDVGVSVAVGFGVTLGVSVAVGLGIAVGVSVAVG